jgi:glycosyltransferase involved in cell wall biosynthesis
MQIDISIIIPVYNALPYFNKCLERLLAQTYDHDKIEVLLIDDGSTDGSENVCDEYAVKYPMFKVVHQENSGTPSIPRNIGLDLAKGEYIFFHDADDYMGIEAVARMLEYAHEWDSDILIPKYGKTTRFDYNRSWEKSNSPKINLGKSTIWRVGGPMKLFRRSFIEDNSLRFHQCYIEDALFVYEAYFLAETISVATDYDYYFAIYREDGNQISTQSASVFFSREYILDFVKLMSELISKYLDTDASNNIILCSVYLRYAWTLRDLFLDKSEGIEEAISELRAALTPIWNQKCLDDSITLRECLELQAVYENRNFSEIEDIFILDFDSDETLFDFNLIDRKLICTCSLIGMDKPLIIDATYLNLHSVLVKHASWSGGRLRLEGIYSHPDVGEEYLVLYLKCNDKSPVIPLKCTSKHLGTVVDKNKDNLIVENHYFSVEIDFKNLMMETFSSGLSRWSIHIGFENSEVTKYVGKNRVSEVFTGFIEGGAVNSDILYIPFETSGRNFCIAEFPISQNVQNEGFAQTDRLNYFNNRIILSALRGGRNDIAGAIIDGITNGNPPEIKFSSEGIKYCYNDEFAVDMDAKEENLYFSINKIKYLEDSEKTGKLIISGKIGWHSTKTPKFIFIVARQTDNQVIAVRPEINEKSYKWMAVFDSDELKCKPRKSLDINLFYYEKDFWRYRKPTNAKSAVQQFANIIRTCLQRKFNR